MFSGHAFVAATFWTSDERFKVILVYNSVKGSIAIVPRPIRRRRSVAAAAFSGASYSSRSHSRPDASKMGNSWTIPPQNMDCNTACSFGGSGGSAATSRMALLNTPAAINYVMNDVSGGGCDSYFAQAAGVSPSIYDTGTRICYYDPAGGVDSGASAADFSQICCCRTPGVGGSELTDEEACPLPAQCETAGRSEAECPTDDGCVWLGRWRTERNAKIATLKQKFKAARGDQKRRKKIRRRLGWTYRQYAGCVGNAGCQSEARCSNYCRPVCGQAPYCEWKIGAGCVHVPTSSPTNSPGFVPPP